MSNLWALLYSDPCEVFTDEAANGSPSDPFEENSDVKGVRTKTSQQEVTLAQKTSSGDSEKMLELNGSVEMT